MGFVKLGCGRENLRKRNAYQCLRCLEWGVGDSEEGGAMKEGPGLKQSQAGRGRDMGRKLK
jgi:hypothetical protein